MRPMVYVGSDPDAPAFGADELAKLGFELPKVDDGLVASNLSARLVRP